jgi:hypothetical protein
MKNFKVKNGKLFDGDKPVKLTIGDAEQIAFIKRINNNAEQLKAGVPVSAEFEFNEEDDSTTGGIEFYCKCGKQLAITKENIDTNIPWLDGKFVGAEIECGDCATPYIIIQPNKNVFEIEVIINNKKQQKKHEIYSSKLLVE